MLLLKAPPTECIRCGKDFDELNEDESLMLDEDGDAVCDDCYRDNCEFGCIRCGEYGNNEDQHRYLVILEECGGLGPGIYRVNRRPYYISNYFNMWWTTWNLSRLRDADGKYCNEGDFPSGHLCWSCQTSMSLLERTAA